MFVLVIPVLIVMTVGIILMAQPNNEILLLSQDSTTSNIANETTPQKSNEDSAISQNVNEVSTDDSSPYSDITIEPSIKPTINPTIKPTAKPTARPTIKPTAKPTATPTAKPTAKPTAMPTVKPTATPTMKPKPTITIVPSPGSSFADFQVQVVELVNKARTSQGLNPLTVNTKLSEVAKIKSTEMSDLGYFSHTSPTYGNPFDMMKQFGISYRTAGENIAYGQSTPKQVMDSWMNSEGHRTNILNPAFKQLGVGIAKNSIGCFYWTQMFIG